MVLTLPVSVCSKHGKNREAQKSDQRLSGRQGSKDCIKISFVKEISFLSKIAFGAVTQYSPTLKHGTDMLNINLFFPTVLITGTT